MSRILIALCVFLLGAAAGGGAVAALRGSSSSKPAHSTAVASRNATPAAAPQPNVEPACPRLVFAVDGTAGPIFCKIDSPAALRYYAPQVNPLLALGPNATPSEVSAVLRTLAPHSTNPITCSAYSLAAWYEQWHFALNPTGLSGVPC